MIRRGREELPFEIRYRLAWDGKLICALLAVFLRAVNAWYRRQARAQGYTGVAARRAWLA